MSSLSSLCQCGTPEDKELMSQTLIAGQLWSQPRIVYNNRQGMLIVTCGRKEWDVAGKRGHAEVGQLFSGTSFLILIPRDEHDTVQCKCRNEAEKWACTAGGGNQGHPRPPKPLWTISGKVWKNRLCMVTNLSRKRNVIFRGGGNLSIKRYPNQAWAEPPGPWTSHQLDQCWNQNWKLVCFLPSFFLFLSIPFFFSLSLSLSSL